MIQDKLLQSIANHRVLQALARKPFWVRLGSHVVDYSLGFDEMVRRGNYKWVNHEINGKAFPIVGEGRVEFEDALFGFGRTVLPSEVGKFIEDIDNEHPWVPAKNENVLAYGGQNPQVQLENKILALGSSSKLRDFHDVLCLESSGAARHLQKNSRVDPYGPDCVFLVVRIKK